MPHYAKNKAVGVMKPGNAFTIEPLISEGVWTDQTWPDNWTAVTTDGKLSAQVHMTSYSYISQMEVFALPRYILTFLVSLPLPRIPNLGNI